MRLLMKSHAAHMSCHSWIVGRPNGVLILVGEERRGNMNRGRSSNQSEYREVLSVQR